ncbi:SEL1-like repeat protein [Helicobacter suis]|uniref:SEL1-like repeat protein n=1 Tax=Helicobacter suis TaxID=104628 RepID=UPI0013D8AE5B|nr:SEL1-like repeat protein [Helicobacter suis]
MSQASTKDEYFKKAVEAYKKRDYQEAFHLFQKAADMESIEDVFNLAHMYSDGQGISQDYGKSVECYKKLLNWDMAVFASA